MATTLEQLLDEFVYTQLQDADNKIRWTRDELTQYVNLALVDLVTRRPEAGVVVDDEYILGTGSIQPLPSTILRLKEIVANTGISGLRFAAAVRQDGYTIDMVFDAVGIAEEDAINALSITVDNVSNALVSVTVTASDVITFVVAAPIYGDQEVLLDFNPNAGTISDSALRELTVRNDVPVTNNSALYQIRYSAVSYVEMRTVIARTTYPTVGAVYTFPLVQQTVVPALSAVNTHTVLAQDRAVAVSATEQRACVAVTTGSGVSSLEVFAATQVDSGPSISATHQTTLLAQSHVPNVSACAVYVLIANPV